MLVLVPGLVTILVLVLAQVLVLVLELILVLMAVVERIVVLVLVTSSATSSQRYKAIQKCEERLKNGRTDYLQRLSECHVTAFQRQADSRKGWKVERHINRGIQCFATTTTLYSLIVSFNTLKLSLNTLKLSSDTHSLSLSRERKSGRSADGADGADGPAGRLSLSL